MRTKNRQLSALWEVDPKAAARTLKRALMRNGGDAACAAEDLGVGRRTVNRWMKRAEFLALEGVA